MGLIKKLYDYKNSLHSKELSIEDYHPNAKPPGPEFKPTMPKGTVRVDVSDVYDWYKLGQHISNLKGLGKHDFGKGPPSTILSFGDEDLEHKYIDALKKTGLDTTDIDPFDPNQPKGMPVQKVDPTYNVNEDVDYMAGHCHVMALALKQLHPDWQLRAHIGWDEEDEEDDEYTDEHRVDHIYIVAPDGSAYDCRGKFKNEQELVGPDETGGAETQFVDYTIADIKNDIRRGELKKFTKDDILKALEFVKRINIKESVKFIEGTNCKNCVWWKKDSEKPVGKDELNKYGGLKPPNKEYIAMSKRVDLVTLPGKDTVKEKGFCYHKDINDWVTERMCCAKWDGKGVLRDYKGESPLMESKEEAVRKIQKFLNKKYDANLDVDGVLGPLTLKSINKFMPQAKKASAPEPEKTTSVQGKKVKEASGYIPSEKEKNDPRFSTALTVDVKPDSIKKNAKAFGFNVSRSGKPPLLKK
jgi:hypothetical protein